MISTDKKIFSFFFEKTPQKTTFVKSTQLENDRILQTTVC